MRPSIILFVAFFACNPWKGVYEREIAFREKVRNGTSLFPELKYARPLRHQQRIIINPDAITYDNRAWWLSLPDYYFLSDDSSHDPLALLTEVEITPLENGVLKDDFDVFRSVRALVDMQEKNRKLSQRTAKTKRALGRSLRGRLTWQPPEFNIIPSSRIKNILIS